MREIVNALFYMDSSGGAWRLLPKDFQLFSTVQKYFWRWHDEGLKRAINHELVIAAREAEGREAGPSAGRCVLDWGEREDCEELVRRTVRAER